MPQARYIGGVFVGDESPHWIKLFHKDPAIYFPKAHGKWVLHAAPSQLADIAHQLKPLIRCGQIEELKYRPTQNDKKGPYAHTDPVLCVYPHPRHTRDVQQQITRITPRPLCWQSEQATEQLHKRLLEQNHS